MLFNSFPFVLFFAVVFPLYLVLPHRWQNRMLLAASCFFYGMWDWRFLLLLLGSVTCDFVCALKIHSSSDPRERRLFLILNCFFSLGILGIFKYFNFFQESLSWLLGLFGFAWNAPLMQIVLPVGISFYTFQAMSYCIDVYRGKIAPVRSYPDYALFVTFFPQLVAGPIERAAHLLPQILKPRQVTLDQCYEGAYLVFWGLFQKVFVADNLSPLVTSVFNGTTVYNGVAVLLGLYAFAIQIYCDFAGYSNMAKGLARCMGFDIMFNFNLPYFARNPREFWQRWHISLSTWLRDYLYIPLGGSRGRVLTTLRNLGLTMILGGLWHGASWTYVIWGGYHGLLLILHRLAAPFLNRVPGPRSVPGRQLWSAARIFFFFNLVCIGWLFFRARHLDQAIAMLRSIFFNFSIERGAGLLSMFLGLLFFSFLLVWVELLQYRKNDLMAVLKLPAPVRGLVYFAMYFLLVIYGAEGGKAFIYFQF